MEKVDIYQKNLFVGRTIRLLIPYIIIQTFYYIFFFRLFFKRGIGLYNWIINLFLLQGFGLGDVLGGISGVAWTLGLEYWIGSLFFPIIYFLKKRINESLFFISMIIFIISITFRYYNSENFIITEFMRLFASYSIGILCVIFYQRFKIKDFKNRKILFSILEIIIIFIIIKIYGKVNYDRRNDYIFPIIAGVLILIFSYEYGIVSQLLKKLSNLGKLSYSMYLVHTFFIDTMYYLNIINPLNYIYLYIIIVIAVSFFIYYFIERKIINLKYHFLVKKS